jgi:hypothetical protein
MMDAFLVPANTVVTAKGDSEAMEITSAGRVFLLTLSVISVVEQEAIDISVYTSADGAAWDAKAAAGMEQKFYPGDYPLLVDLSQNPDAKFVRAHWDVYRWGRGSTDPRFEIGVRLREVPQEEFRGMGVVNL